MPESKENPYSNIVYITVKPIHVVDESGELINTLTTGITFSVLDVGYSISIEGKEIDCVHIIDHFNRYGYIPEWYLDSKSHVMRRI